MIVEDNSPTKEALTVSPSQTLADKPTAKDKRAWALAKMGKSEEEIAAMLGISVAAVKFGIVSMELHHTTSASADAVAIRVNEEVLTGIDGVGDYLKGARAAKRYVGINPETQQPIYVDDFDTGLKAVKELRELAAVTQPRAAGVSVAIQNNNVGIAGGGVGRSFEALTREAEKRHRTELMERAMAEGKTNLSSTPMPVVEAEFEEMPDGNGESESVPDVELDDPEEVDDDSDEE